MKLGWTDKEETFEYAIEINRCIEFIYKKKHYWIDTKDGKRAIFYGSNIIAEYENAEEFLKNAKIDGISIKEVIEHSHIVSY